MHRPNVSFLVYWDWGKLLQSHLLAQDWRGEYMTARRGMLSKRLRNEHSRTLRCGEAQPLCKQPHRHLYRAASRCWAKPQLHTHPAPGETRASNALEHSCVGGSAGVSGSDDKDLSRQPPACVHGHVHTSTHSGRKLFILSEDASPSLSAPQLALLRSSWCSHDSKSEDTCSKLNHTSSLMTNGKSFHFHDFQSSLV